MNPFKLLQSAFFALCVACASEAMGQQRMPTAGSPHVLNIVLIDASGSMSAGRLATAVAEIKQLARGAPPSGDLRWVVIVFRETAEPAREFQNGFDEFAACLDSIQAGGGTAIASGMQAACAEARRHYGVPHLVVVLYSDGEDGDQQAVQRQEVELGKLFDERSDKGLGQTVICRRWGRANAQLVAWLAQRKDVRTIDAGEARLVGVAVEPAIELQNAQWSMTERGVIELRASARASLARQGVKGLTPLRFKCLTPGVAGDTSIDVSIDPPAVRDFTLKVKPTSLTPLPKTIELEFEIDSPASAASGQELIVPTLSRNRIAASINVPPLVLQGLVAHKLTKTGPAQWIDPLMWRARAFLELTLDVREDPRLPSAGAVTFSIEPQSGCSLAEGDRTLKTTGAGVYQARFAVDFEADHRDGKGCGTGVGIAITATQLPPGILIEPERAEKSITIEPPPGITTRLAARCIGVGPARWVRLIDSVAAFEADVEITVDGPLGGNTRLLIVSPPQIRAIQCTPAVVHTGRQVVKLRLDTTLPAAPTASELKFQLKPPLPQGAVAMVAPNPFAVQVSGPPIVLASFLQNGKAVEQVEAHLTSQSPLATLAVRPMVWGVTPQATDGLTFQIIGAGPIAISPRRLKALEDGLLEISIPESTFSTPSSWIDLFYDRTFEARIRLTVPTKNLIPVRSVEQKLVVSREAPFKRILFGAGVGLFSMVVMSKLARAVWNRNS